MQLATEEVFIEYCVNCQHHAWCTFHEQSRYLYFLDITRKAILDKVPSATIVENTLPRQFLRKVSRAFEQEASFRIWDERVEQYVRFPRVGAFEVYWNGRVIYSKLRTGMWPNPTMVAAYLKELVRDKNKNTTSRLPEADAGVFITRGPDNVVHYDDTTDEEPYIEPRQQPAYFNMGLEREDERQVIIDHSAGPGGTRSISQPPIKYSTPGRIVPPRRSPGKPTPSPQKEAPLVKRSPMLKKNAATASAIQKSRGSKRPQRSGAAYLKTASEVQQQRAGTIQNLKAQKSSTTMRTADSKRSLGHSQMSKSSRLAYTRGSVKRDSVEPPVVRTSPSPAFKKNSSKALVISKSRETTQLSKKSLAKSGSKGAAVVKAQARVSTESDDEKIVFKEELYTPDRKTVETPHPTKPDVMIQEDKPATGMPTVLPQSVAPLPKPVGVLSSSKKEFKPPVAPMPEPLKSPEAIKTPDTGRSEQSKKVMEGPAVVDPTSTLEVEEQYGEDEFEEEEEHRQPVVEAVPEETERKEEEQPEVLKKPPSVRKMEETKPIKDSPKASRAALPAAAKIASAKQEDIYVSRRDTPPKQMFMEEGTPPVKREEQEEEEQDYDQDYEEEFDQPVSPPGPKQYPKFTFQQPYNKGGAAQPAVAKKSADSHPKESPKEEFKKQQPSEEEQQAKEAEQEEEEDDEYGDEDFQNDNSKGGALPPKESTTTEKVEEDTEQEQLREEESKEEQEEEEEEQYIGGGAFQEQRGSTPEIVPAGIREASGGATAGAGDGVQLASDSEGEEEEDEDGEGQEADDTQIEITKAFDMELPILKMCNKKINYYNADSETNVFQLHSSHPDYMGLKEAEVTIAGQSQGKFQLRFSAVEEACEQQYVLFVLKNGQPWENILFSVSYHA